MATTGLTCTHRCWRVSDGEGWRSLRSGLPGVATSPWGSVNTLGTRVEGLSKRRLTLDGGLTGVRPWASVSHPCTPPTGVLPPACGSSRSPTPGVHASNHTRHPWSEGARARAGPIRGSYVPSPGGW